MADFGQNRLWPKPTLAKPTLAKPTLTYCVVCCVWCVVCFCVAWVLVSRFHGVGFHVWCWFVRVQCPRDCPSRRPPFRGPEDRLPEDRPSRRPPFPWTALNFALFSLSPAFLPSLEVFSWNFGGVFERRDPQMCTFGLSGCRVKPRRLRGRRGFTRQPVNSKRAHLSAPALQTPLKFHEKTPREGRKERILRRESEKKKRKFLGPPHPGPPPFGPPLHLGWAPTLLAPTLRTRTHGNSTHTQKKPKQLISKKNQTINSKKTKIFTYN